MNTDQLKEHLNLFEKTTSDIDDTWFKQPGSFQTYKLAKPIQYRIAAQPGTIETLEGPVDYEQGHFIITGPKGEEYPVSELSFNDKYTDHGDGTATPKKIVKLARLADHDGVIHTTWGDLEYTDGKDYIVRHGVGDYGVVKQDIFNQTYDTSKVPQK